MEEGSIEVKGYPHRNKKQWYGLLLTDSVGLAVTVP